MPGIIVEQGKITHQRLQAANPQRVRVREYAQKLSQPVLLRPLAKVTEQIAVSLRRDLRGERQGHTPTSVNMKTTQEDRTPTNFFGKKPGLPGSSKRQEWEWQQRQQKERERQAQQGSSGRGGRGGERPVAGGQGGHDDYENLRQLYEQAKSKRGDLLREAEQLRLKGNVTGFNKKMLEALRIGEEVEHYRQETMRAGGMSEQEIQRAERFRDTLSTQQTNRIMKLKDKMERKGLSRKEMDEYNKFKEMLGDYMNLDDQNT
jgi:uncharacterized membrane protein